MRGLVIRLLTIWQMDFGSFVFNGLSVVRRGAVHPMLVIQPVVAVDQAVSS